MAEEQTPDNQQDIPQPDITTPIETPRLQDITNDPPSTVQAAGSSTQNASSEEQRIAVRDEHHNTKWSRADKISTWGEVINVGMAAVTIGAVLIALDASKSGDINFAKALTEGKKSADASVKAANAAENTLNVTKDAIKSSTNHAVF